MPVLSRGALRIDCADEGQGEPVVLIHSSVSGNRQWRSLSEALRDRFRLLAINLHGYGDTTPWPATSRQSLHAQAQLVLAVCEEVRGKVHLVGHSLGGAVAFKAATLLGPRVDKMVLLEPNPFNLLEQAGRTEAFMEALALRDDVKSFGSRDEWEIAAQRFADYWLGDGSWRAMPDKRRAAFAQALRPNFHEWDAVLDEETTIDDWGALAPRTLLVSDRATRRPIREIVALLEEACPHWAFHFIEGGGHMAPLTHPQLINPVVREFLARPA